MEDRSYKIIYRFKHENGDRLQEIKYIDVLENTPKSKKYQWFHIKNNETIPLTFLSQNGSTRSFVEGTLIVYPEYCLFNGERYDLREPKFPVVCSVTFYQHGLPKEDP